MGSRKTLSDCELVNLELPGHPFIWEKSRGTEAWVDVCLHRAMGKFFLGSIFSFFKTYQFRNLYLRSFTLIFGVGDPTGSGSFWKCMAQGADVLQIDKES
uniref:Uncharacterized protein n=1 Tax=Cannabis sativa TaxID=3483 RepID=A0A803PEF5_CANSA